MGNTPSRDLAVAAIPLTIAAILIYKDQQNAKNKKSISNNDNKKTNKKQPKLFRSSRRVGDEETPCSTCDDENEEEEYLQQQEEGEGEFTQTINTTVTSIDEETKREIEELKQRRAEMAADASRVRRSMKKRYGEQQQQQTSTTASSSFDEKYSSPSSTRHRNNYKTLGMNQDEVNNSPSLFHNSRITRHEDVIGDVIDQDILFHRNQQQQQQQNNGDETSPVRNENNNQVEGEETSASRYHYETYYVSPTTSRNNNINRQNNSASRNKERYVGAMTVSSSVNNSLNASPFASTSRSRGAGRVIIVEKDFTSTEEDQQQQQVTSSTSTTTKKVTIVASASSPSSSSSVQRAIKRNHLAGSEIPGMQASSLRGEAARPVSEFLLLDPEIRKEIKREASIRTYKEQLQRRDEIYASQQQQQNAFDETLNGTGIPRMVADLHEDDFAPGQRQQQIRGSIRYTSMRHQRTAAVGATNSNQQQNFNHEEFGQHFNEDEELDDDENHNNEDDFKQPPRFHHVAQSEEQANQERFQQVVELLFQEHEDGASGVARFEDRDRLNIVRQHENWIKKQQKEKLNN